MGVGSMSIKKVILTLLTSLVPFYACGAAEDAAAFSKSWDLGGGLTVKFQSDTHFDYTQNDEMQISAHLPGLYEADLQKQPSILTLNHHYAQGSVQLHQEEDQVNIVSPWKEKFPPDFIHLLYGAARVSWLEQGIFPVHAACIGNDQEGYVLLMGAPGSGKTSLTLNAAFKQDYKVFSGDKTLLRFNDRHHLEAISGTHTITVRMTDAGRWAEIPKVHEHLFGDRLAFQLLSDYYSTKSTVPIRMIVLVSLNDGVEVIEQLSPTSALHTLYPFFMDKQREDILVGNDQAFFDGTVSSKIRAGLAKNLKLALEEIPVYKAVASLKKITALINKNVAENKIEHKKILFGICGLSNGHCSRQLPVIKYLLEQGHEILIFTYGDGLAYFKDRLPKSSLVKIIPVANPYYVGTPQGLDFELTANSDKNNIDFNRINSLAMDRAAKEFGRPDLVISDYEMAAAQYAYAKNIPLVTLDQQSKYLVGDFAPILNGTSYIDEVERLSLFFPKAKKRIAVSFFRVEGANRKTDFDVEVLSPMIRPEVLEAKGIHRSGKPSILVYVTAQQLGDQPIEEWIDTIRSALPESYEAHLFLPQRVDLPENDSQLNFYHHGDKRFDPLLFSCHGIITTAGHNLLSEAMYLEKPVFALPLPLYEQQLNAHIIDEGGFGLSRASLSVEELRIFFANLDTYTRNINKDKKYLLKEPGNTLIIDKIDKLLKE
jgi:uncharacterized protein (TIGR00661 family)